MNIFLCLIAFTFFLIFGRLEDFVEWMNGVEDSVKSLEQECLSTQQYRDTVAQFQVRFNNEFTYIARHSY